MRSLKGIDMKLLMLQTVFLKLDMIPANCATTDVAARCRRQMNYPAASGRCIKKLCKKHAPRGGE